jgi:hypothetical protein
MHGLLTLFVIAPYLQTRGGLTVELVQHDDAMAASKEAPLTHGILKVGLVVDDLNKTSRH